MKNNDYISYPQLIAAAFVAVMAPLTPLVGRPLVSTAGYAAWLSVCLSLCISFAIVGFMLLLLRNVTEENGGFCGAVCRTLGKWPGRALLLVYAAWMVFYSGFMLRTGADRFAETVYPGTSPSIFIFIVLAACFAAAIGPLGAIGRSAVIFRAVMLLIIGFVGIFSIEFMDFGGNFAVTPRQLPDAAKGAFSVGSTFSLVCYTAFIKDRVRGKAGPAAFFLWTAALTAVLLLICICITGTFGAEVCANMTHPFFVLVRDISIFGAAERIEAVIVALWVFSDFIFISLFLYTALHILEYLFPGKMPPAETRRQKVLRIKGRGIPALLCCAGAALSALLISGNYFTLNDITRQVILWINRSLVYGALPLVFIVGKARKTL